MRRSSGGTVLSRKSSRIGRLPSIPTVISGCEGELQLLVVRLQHHWKFKPEREYVWTPLVRLFKRNNQKVSLVSKVIGPLQIRLLQGPLGLLKKSARPLQSAAL